LFQLDSKSSRSIYEQVIDRLKEEIVRGVLAPDEKLPSVRDLSRQLTINPNTVQKAYRELEREGYCYTVSGLGTFVSPPENIAVDQARIEETKNEIKQLLKELQYLKLTEEDILSFVREELREKKALLFSSSDTIETPKRGECK